jgi:hypothetical protein
MKRAIVGLVIAILLLAGGYTAYTKTQLLNENRCWGCLSLNPKGKLYDDFWVEYPEGYGKEGAVSHPDWLKEELDTKSVVMLFFWYIGCTSCKVLWEHMQGEGLVEGDEDDGRLVGFNNASLLTIDTTDKDDERRHSFSLYTQKGGAPVTVILFKKDSEIYWYAFEGAEYPKDENGKTVTVQKILEDALRR